MIVGQPTDYAISSGQIRLYPFPGVAYPLSILGVIDQAPLNYTDPTSQNAWTNEAQDLIVARAKMLLFRDYFRDSEQAAIASGTEQQALSRLTGTATEQLGTGRMRGAW